MKLKDIMTKDVIAVSPETTVFDAAMIMRDKNLSLIHIYKCSCRSCKSYFRPQRPQCCVR